jgi:dipeptidase E
MPGTNFFSWAKPVVKSFLGAGINEVVFVPFAAVTIGYDTYSETVSKVFEDMGIRLRPIHREGDMVGAMKNAQAIVVGGGNSFALLNAVYARDLLTVIRAQVNDGTPYVGWSAGANLACPTIKTTNDMPVVVPPSLDALNLVPFQINPHYHELKFENQGGETRKERLQEFLVLNPDKKVIGLPEGMFVERNNDVLVVGGNGTAKLFEAGKEIAELHAGANVDYLLAGESK